MTFGQRLKQLIKDKNITQLQLSEELNIAVSTLSGYANDHREPDFLTLTQFARYFHVSTDYLLGISSTPCSAIDTTDDNAKRLLNYYERLSPELKGLLIDQAKLLWKYNLQESEGATNEF